MQRSKSNKSLKMKSETIEMFLFNHLFFRENYAPRVSSRTSLRVVFSLLYSYCMLKKRFQLQNYLLIFFSFCWHFSWQNTRKQKNLKLLSLSNQLPSWIQYFFMCTQVVNTSFSCEVEALYYLRRLNKHFIFHHV